MNEVEKFAQAVIGDNPLEAHAKIWGLERAPGETDDSLEKRLREARGVPPLPRPLQPGEMYCHLCKKFLPIASGHLEVCTGRARKRM